MIEIQEDNRYYDRVNVVAIEEMRPISKRSVDEAMLMKDCVAGFEAKVAEFLEMVERVVGPDAVVRPGMAVAHEGPNALRWTTEVISERVDLSTKSYVRAARGLYVEGWGLGADGLLVAIDAGTNQQTRSRRRGRRRVVGD